MKRILLLITGIVVAFATFKYFSPISSLEHSPSLSAYDQYVAEKIEKKRAGQSKADAPEMHAIIERERRTRIGDNEPKYGPNQVMEEFRKARARMPKTGNLRTSENLNFIERGPGNVGGRTRGLLVDPDDPTHQTFYAGAASGGIWKTTDQGSNWIYISSDIPNLGTNTLAMSAANTNVIYAGTGEHFTNDIDGAGMFKSTDKGNTWTQIADPSDMPDFKNVSRIIVDPADEDVVVATTRSTVWGSFRSSIYKTTDGGTNWTRLRTSTSERYDDLDYDPADFNKMYAAIDGIGVIKSTDGGMTWSDASVGLEPSGRVEITISPVNSNRLWASVEGSLSGSGSDLYVSSDGAATWTLAVNSNMVNEDFLGGQGWYDNIITPHPFDADIVYVGGVNLWKFELTGASAGSVKTVNVTEDGTDSFMSFISFGGAYYGGALDIGDNITEDDLLSVEVRFGQGSQMAHRFTVGGQGAGVQASGYSYEDYVTVPFQVWDVTNNRQLMVSFRDQQEDGKWNLIESNTSSADASQHSREYVFIHDITYSTSPSSSVTTTGGQEVNQLYFYWPVLTSGANFNENSLPNTTLEITIDELTALTRSTTNVSDAYGQFDGPNRFPQSTREQGIHPDQHNLLIYDIDQTTQAFRMLIGNDGGVYISVKDTDPGVKEGDFDFISYGYNTTQFYGADKAPGQDRYFGGMQDNGSWYNATGTEGSASSQSTFGIGGDGFEVLWHSTNVSRMIGGSQYNGMGRSLTGGNSWESATTGLPFGAGQAPFITRLSHHKSSPDRIFAVAATGVYRSTNFGGAWIASTMNEASQWSFNNSADVEVSYADPDVVWAGGSLDNNRRLYVSTNAGVTFNPVNNYTVHNLGFVSGIGTHPSDSKIAYALFSFAGFPKVLRTTDMGQSWTDISGFNGTGSASTRGFPDVAVNCIYVFEDNPARIWVGSEIGIIESLDNGQSWNLLNANLPPVNVYDFKKVDDQLVIATYGRGIWSVTLEQNFSLSVDRLYVTPAGDWKADVTFEDTFDSVEVVLQNALVETLRAVAPGSTSLTFIASGADGLKTFKLDAYKDGIKQQSVSNQSMLFQIGDVVDAYSTNFEETASDFVADELTIANFPNLAGKGIHSAHPYKENEEAVMYFKRPVEVQPGGRLYYRDIALIEPGQANSVHTEEAFRDYVIVEGTSNGFDWLPLEGGYDASLHSDWTAAFTSNQVTSALFKNQTVDLNSAFTSGDKILIRFRLYSDATAAGWGWVIDDFYVQEEPLALRTTINDELELFPNPVTETATIRFSDKVPTEIKVIDLQGKLVEVISNHDQEKILTWNPSNALKGVFLLQYEMDGERYSSRVVVE